MRQPPSSSRGADDAIGVDVVDGRKGAQALYAELGLAAETLERVRLKCPCPIEDAAFADESFDIIFSQAAYQKFRDPVAATKNIARMLRPGGLTSHQIDLRDNRDFSKPLAFLEVSELEWRITRSNRSPTNRWRASDILEAFRVAGLFVLESVATRRIEVTRGMAESFSPRFRGKTLEDLGILGLFLVARKPSAQVAASETEQPI